VRDSLEAFLDAFEAFLERLVEVRWTPLALAVALHLVNMLVRTYAWRNIVAAAYPQATVRWRHTFGAYAAGVAVNAVMPARAGDPVKLLLLHRRVPGATYPTLAATLVAETLLDLVVASALLLWAWQAGLLPLPDLPVPAFELSWILDHVWVIPAFATVLLIGVLVLGTRVRAFWERVRQGLVILTTPGRYLLEVVSFQLIGWGCRIAGAWAFLAAFNITPSLESALLVQVASSAATSLPATPGGLGPKQALLVVLLAGEAARTDVLAFSVGMEMTSLVTNLVLGAAALALMLGGLRFRRVIADARSRDVSPDR